MMNGFGGVNNVTEEDLNDPAFHVIRLFSGTFFAVGILVNMALVITSILDPLKCLRSTTGSFILNLSLSNLLCSLGVFIASAWCQSITNIFALVCQSLATTSCSFAVVLSFDRFFLFARPIWYNQTVGNVKTRAAVWVASVSSTLSFHFAYLNLRNDWRVHFLTVVTGAKFVLFISVDIATLRKLKKLQENFMQQIQTSGVIQATAQQRRFKTERQFFVVAVLMFANYLLFMVPFNVFYDVRLAFHRDMDASIVSGKRFFSIFFLLPSLHSLVHSVSYFTAIQKYRKSFLAMRYPAYVMERLTTLVMSCIGVTRRQ